MLFTYTLDYIVKLEDFIFIVFQVIVLNELLQRLITFQLNLGNFWQFYRLRLAKVVDSSPLVGGNFYELFII